MPKTVDTQAVLNAADRDAETLGLRDKSEPHQSYRSHTLDQVQQNKTTTSLVEPFRIPKQGSNGPSSEDIIQSACEPLPVGGWSKFAQTLRDQDKAKIDDHKEDIDTLLVFAGLFSAVLTAFNIEAYKTLKQDSSDTSVMLLANISQQLNSFSVNAGFINSTSFFSPLAVPFQATKLAVRINTLWFCSLVFSLVTASLGMLVKQWLREYMSLESISPQAHVRVRHFRHRGLTQWHVFEIAGCLPLLLQLALVLFFLGLSEFTRSLNPVVGWVTTAFIILWLFLFVSTSLAPALYASCPYKTPVIKSVVRVVRQYLPAIGRMQLRPLFPNHAFWNFLPNTIAVLRFSAESRVYVEKELCKDVTKDVDIVLEADAMFLDDQFLEIVRPCLMDMNGPDVVKCIRGVSENRLDEKVMSLQSTIGLSRWTGRTGGTKGQATVIHILLDVLERELDEWSQGRLVKKWSSWMDEVLSCICVYACHLRADGPVQLRAATLFPRLLSTGNAETSKQILRTVEFCWYVFRRKMKHRMQFSSCHAINNIVSAAHVILTTTEDNPVELARLVLSLLTLCTRYDILRDSWDTCEQLFLAFPSEIQQRMQQGDWQANWPRNAHWCLHHCDVLCGRFPGLNVPDNFFSILKEIQDSSITKSP